LFRRRNNLPFSFHQEAASLVSARRERVEEIRAVMAAVEDDLAYWRARLEEIVGPERESLYWRIKSIERRQQVARNALREMERAAVASDVLERLGGLETPLDEP
jgi:hypothetical protein